jgi:hypothetical protein
MRSNDKNEEVEWRVAATADGDGNDDDDERIFPPFHTFGGRSRYR